MTPSRALLVLVLLAVVTAPTTASAQREPSPRQRAASEFVDRARGDVERRDPGCRVRFVPPRATFTDDPPSPELLATFALLRRPQRPEERLSEDDRLGFGAQGIYRNHIRLARSASGRTLFVLAARDAMPAFPRRPERCLAAFTRRLHELTREADPAIRRLARQAGRAAVRDEREEARRRPQEGLFLFDNGPTGRGGGGGISVDAVRARGLFNGTSSGRGRGSTLNGLIPDGVARIDMTFARTSRDPNSARRYARAVRRTVAVRDNVVSLTVPREGIDVFPSRMVWRGSDGRILRTVPGPG